MTSGLSPLVHIERMGVTLSVWRAFQADRRKRAGDDLRQDLLMSQIEITPYDAAAPSWSRKIETLGYRAAYRDLLARHAPASVAGLRVLDAGCGSGDFAAALQAARGSVGALTLLDPSAEMLAAAQSRLPDSQTHKGVIDHLPAAPRFDLILSAHALEHCTDLARSLIALAGAMKPGGQMILVLSKPHWCNLLIWFRWRHRILSPAKVRAAALVAGLHITTEHPFPSGPPSRTSRAYILRRSHADRYR